MKNFERKTILPALMRPGMYTGEQGDRTLIEWHADAVAEYLNAMLILEDRYANAAKQSSDDTPSATLVF